MDVANRIDHAAWWTDTTPPVPAETGHVAASQALPLVIDLDGTLLRTDLLDETFVAVLRCDPLSLPRLARAAWQGRAALKQELAACAEIDLNTIPIDDRVAAYATDAKAEGREVYLATAADGAIARRIAARFSFVDGVIASDGETNLKGETKAKALAARFPDGFIYAGDCGADLAVWRAAKGTVIVSASPRVEAAAQSIREPLARFERERPTPRLYARALRLHQWAKNALIFVPLVLGGKALDVGAWGACALGFLALGLLASSTYLLNDLWDLPDDRRHWSKRERPLASGRLPIRTALLLAPLGVGASLSLGAFLGPAALGMLCLYLGLTLAYSFRLKREPLLDGFSLAVLFTLRIGLGVALAGTLLSPWLLTFSLFLFTSLSLAKRYTEVERMVRHGCERTPGRGYRAGDGPLLLALGSAAGIGAVLVMVLYLIHDAMPASFYGAPAYLWAFPPVLFLWIGRVWLLCGRGELNDDPVAFALKDRVSLALGTIMGVAFLAASFGGGFA